MAPAFAEMEGGRGDEAMPGWLFPVDGDETATADGRKAKMKVLPSSLGLDRFLSRFFSVL
jgi:hypothetical protein